MKLFQCHNCRHPVYFENVVCEKCQSWLGYHPERDEMIALFPGGEVWNFEFENGRAYRYCSNHNHAVCNWLIPADKENGFCSACDLNDVIPNISEADHLTDWRKLEEAKHRLVYALRRLGLPVYPKTEDYPQGLIFDFLAPEDARKPVMTGHDEGRITINTQEADPVKREAMRLRMDERYRTLIGHFRHEVGHYYWNLLIRGQPEILAAFRNLFGDEREDYGEALKRHYKNGSPDDWTQNYISEYATSHAWEDWAETWAHYLHLLDLLETAYSFRLQLAPPVDGQEMMHIKADFDPYLEGTLKRILREAVPVTFAVNSLNRGMGRKDIYPFMLNNRVQEKLTFVHQLVCAAGGRAN